MKLFLRQIDVSHRLLTVRKMSIGKRVAGGSRGGGGVEAAWWGRNMREGGWGGGGVDKGKCVDFVVKPLCLPS